MTASDGSSHKSGDHERLHRAAVETIGGEPLNARQRERVEGAVSLVERALRAWPIRDPLGWVTEIVQLDVGRANTALARLIREHATTPSYAAFFEIYRNLDTTLPPQVIGPSCEVCGGSGAVDCTDDRRHGRSCTHRGTSYGEPGDCWCRATVPCDHCHEGDRMRLVMRRIAEVNAATLRAAGAVDEERS